MHLAHAQILVLNRLWQAVNVCSVERGIALLFSGHAFVVHEQEGTFATYSFDEWTSQAVSDQEAPVIRTVSRRIPFPRILILRVFDRVPRVEVKFSRQNVFARDNDTCQYCNQRLDRKRLNLDHVVPRQQGGPTNWTNVVCSCRECNSRKANRTPEQAGMRLHRPPARPRWRPMPRIQLPRKTAMEKSADIWRHFVDLAP